MIIKILEFLKVIFKYNKFIQFELKFQNEGQ